MWKSLFEQFQKGMDLLYHFEMFVYYVSDLKDFAPIWDLTQTLFSVSDKGRGYLGIEPNTGIDKRLEHKSFTTLYVAQSMSDTYFLGYSKINK